MRSWNIDSDKDTEVVVDFYNLKEPLSTFSSDGNGYYLIGSKTGKIFFYDSMEHKSQSFSSDEEKNQCVYCSCLRTNHISYSGYENGTLLIYDWNKKNVLYKSFLYQNTVLTSCCFYNNKILIITANNKTINFFDTTNKEIIHTYIDGSRYKGPESIKAMKFVVDMSYIIVCGADGGIRAYKQL